MKSKVLSPVSKRHHTTATDADPHFMVDFTRFPRDFLTRPATNRQVMSSCGVRYGSAAQVRTFLQVRVR
jgi:hypothetical protein